MQNTSEKSRTNNDDQSQPMVMSNGMTSQCQTGPTILPNPIGVGEQVVPLIPFAMNYHPNVALPLNYPATRAIPCRLPAQYSAFQIPLSSSNQKRPVLGNAQNSQSLNSPGPNVPSNYGRQSGLSRDNPIGRKKSLEKTMSDSDTQKKSDVESSEATTNRAQSLMSEMKSCPWSSRTDASIPKQFTFLQPQPLMTQPNFFLPLPLMCPNPAIKLASSHYQLIPNTHRHNEDNQKGGQFTDRQETFSVNPWFVHTTKESDTNKEASALKDQIIKNVEELFNIATKTTSPKTDEMQDSKIDRKNPHDTEGLLDETLDGDVSLMEIVLLCCIEVEAYWTEAQRDSNARALILGCCKSIRRLISSDFRHSETNMISSLQELTLSLILLFLISSLS